ncbi:hypothetical protein NLI96_g3451 [Meripilus lineatus]|uniref:Uncharacterized protein n=1 Tax=Meripilus lineatus TaxID=2056292 RepID=A0AAD5VC69_9APHY|nr:hypothetical protein NLI96_g3451 [Physisporinus lineatus]
MEQNQWIGIACAIDYFLVFGTTKEARYRYKSAALKLIGLIGVRRNTTYDGVVAKPNHSTLVFAQRSRAVSQSRDTAQPEFYIGDKAEIAQSNGPSPSVEQGISGADQDDVVETTRPKSITEIV